MFRRFLQSALVVSLFATSLTAQTTKSDAREKLLKAVADEKGFTASGSPAQYDETNVDKLNPGIAAALKVYGFTGITTQDWSSSGRTIKGTFIEMLPVDSAAAYGYYTSLRSAPGGEATPTLIGADSFRRAGKLYFWQSNFVVELEGPAESAESMNALAKILSRNILGRSRKPTVSEYLPPANIVPGSEKYFITPEGIPSAAGVDPGKLGFDSSAEVATATYRVKGAEFSLMLVLYPTQHVAKKYTDALPSSPNTFRKRAGPLFALVYGTNAESNAAAILDGVSHEYKGTWEEPKPGLGLGPIIIAVVTFVVIVLGFTVIMGFGFGGLRIFMHRRQEEKALQNPQSAEFTQLKLIQGVTDKRIGE